MVPPVHWSKHRSGMPVFVSTIPHILIHLVPLNMDTWNLGFKKGIGWIALRLRPFHRHKFRKISLFCLFHTLCPPAQFLIRQSSYRPFRKTDFSYLRLEDCFLMCTKFTYSKKTFRKTASHYMWRPLPYPNNQVCGFRQRPLCSFSFS